MCKGTFGAFEVKEVCIELIRWFCEGSWVMQWFGIDLDPKRNEKIKIVSTTGGLRANPLKSKADLIL